MYLDYNATAPIRSSVKSITKDFIDTFYGNPSSVHTVGQRARSMIEDARYAFKDIIGNDFEVYFVSGATEANSLIINSFDNVITSEIEHDSIYNAKDNLNVCRVNSNGIIDLNHLEDLLKKATTPTLLSIMFANNESGVIQPIEEVVKLSKKYSAIVHSDIVQAIGKVNFDWNLLDAMSISSHKLGGLSGTGALVVDKKLTKFLRPMIKGGGQEKGFRAGTENLLGIAAFKVALEDSMKDDWSFAKMTIDKLENQITNDFKSCKILGRDEKRLQNTSYIYTPDILGLTQVMRFDLDGFFVSSGAACSSGLIKTSRTLNAMIKDDNLQNGGAIRVSICPNTYDLSKFYKAFKDFLIYKGIS